MNRKITLGAAVTLAIMFSTVTFITTMIYAEKTFDSRVFNIKERETMHAQLAEVDRVVRQEYYNVIDESELSENLVRGYLAGIGDDYSVYKTAEQYSAEQNTNSGRTGDIGVVCSQDPGGYILIDEVYPDSPAFISDLAVGDLIVKVDELNVTAENYNEAVDALRGDPGTTLSLVTRRDSVEKVTTVTRRRVNRPVMSGRVIGTIGYIQIKEFSENAPEQFYKLLTEYTNNQQVSSLVFDVRNVSVGNITALGKILDRLLPEGNVISATYRNSSEPTVLVTSDSDEVTLPMAVLVNAKTSSMAELFAQSLRDFGKARLVGVTTAGNGSMLATHRLSDGSALEFTVALYQTPVSPNFEGVGVKVDYEVKMPAELEKELENLDENSDLQLRRALDVVAASVKDQSEPGQVVDPLAPSEPEEEEYEYIYTGEDDDIEDEEDGGEDDADSDSSSDEQSGDDEEASSGDDESSSN